VLRRSIVTYNIHLLIRAVFDFLIAPFLVLFAIVARFVPSSVDIGLGPSPIINSTNHKKALVQQGYKVEIFVDSLWYYTKDFDIAPKLLMHGPLRVLIPYVLAVWVFFRYRSLYTYFDGGPLHTTAWLYRLEPFLLKLAGVRTVIMAFGADVHVLTRSPDRYLVHAYGRDYPEHRFLHRRIARKIDLWTAWADHIIAGCDWIYYLPYWDTLALSHFAVDTDLITPAETSSRNDGVLRLLHAPNHRFLKGTEFVLRAVEDLAREGFAIELKLLEKATGEEVLEAIAEADLVIDQLIIGWYAMFAIESMAIAKPCICYINPDLEKLFVRAGQLESGELPLISATPESLKETLRNFAIDRSSLREYGIAGRTFVENHHSLASIGDMFHAIENR